MRVLSRPGPPQAFGLHAQAAGASSARHGARSRIRAWAGLTRPEVPPANQNKGPCRHHEEAVLHRRVTLGRTWHASRAYSKRERAAARHRGVWRAYTHDHTDLSVRSRQLGQLSGLHGTPGAVANLFNPIQRGTAGSR